MIKSVFEGGDGWESGGRLDRSSDSVGREDDDDRDERLALKEEDADIGRCGGEDVV